jgi:toxin ParE1/3/4
MTLVVYHCEADVELVAAAKYYKCQREQLGHRFLHAVHVALARIQEDPERFPFHEAPTRECRVVGFPYRLVYEVLPDAIYIIAVAHMSREPGYWRNRLS